MDVPYAQLNKSVFRRCLNVVASERMSFSSADFTHVVQRQRTRGRRIAAPSVKGKRSPLLKARKDERDGMSATGVSRSEV